MKTPEFNFLDFDNQYDYQQWRSAMISAYQVESMARKLKVIPCSVTPSPAEHEALRHCINDFSLALFKLPTGFSIDDIINFGHHFGLKALDKNLCADENAISKITDTRLADNSSSVEGKREYIPYTSKPLGWHTDGYYNEQPICSMMLVCEQPASVGGENEFIDPRMAYIYLRDHGHDYAKALFEKDCLTVPANQQGQHTLRNAVTGPVFSITANGHLHMRYSARSHNIIWKDHPYVHKAAALLLKFYMSDQPYIIKHKLSAGEGIICRNVLHKRCAYTDDPLQQPRTLYRGRYFEELR